MRGNLGAGPTKALDESSLAAGGQRWRFIPLNQRLKSVSARPSSLPPALFNSTASEVDPDDTLFSNLSAALEANSEINLTLTFSDYLRQVKPLTHSLPLIYRNRKRLVTLTLEALLSSTKNGAEATPSIASCLTALAKDLGPQEFLSFFPQVVEMFAVILDVGRTGAGSSDDATKEVSGPTVLWDPQVSMVPIFASLAEISKDSLHVLSSNPSRTIQSLVPLLSNPHYRVREMTAEACLGYLIRKCRDINAMKDLVRKLLEVSEDKTLDDGKEPYLLDGLGDSLFEAVRLPAGHLHSRACDLLRCALLQVKEIRTETQSYPQPNAGRGRRMIQVLSLCLSRLSRHLKSSEDARPVSLVFLEIGSIANKEKNVMTTGDIAFLSNRWLQTRGRGASLATDQLMLQRFLLAFSKWATSFASHAYVVYECLDGIAVILSASSGDKSRESTRRVLLLVLSKISEITQSECLICAIDMLCRAETRRGQKVDASTLLVCAKLCDQLAKLQIPSQPGCQLGAISTFALDSALSFLQSCPGIELALQGSSAVSFRAPTLESQILTFISNFADGQQKMLADEPFSYLFRRALEYLSTVQFVEDHAIFHGLVSMQGLSVDDCGRLLNAIVVQLGQNWDDIPLTFKSKALILVEHLLAATKNFSVTSIGIDSLVMFTRLFPAETTRLLTSHQEKPESYVQMLTSTLGSTERTVRTKTSEMLHIITSFLDGRISPKTCHVRNGFDREVQEIIEDMRISFQTESGASAGFFGAVRYVFTSLTKLSATDDSLRLLREMARLLSKASNTPRLIPVAAVHFSIGLLNTPFKPLWECAGNIWSAAASLLGKEAVSLMTKIMKRAENRLIMEASGNRKDVFDSDADNREATQSKGENEIRLQREMQIVQIEETQKGVLVKEMRKSWEETKSDKTALVYNYGNKNKLPIWKVILKRWDSEEWKKHYSNPLSRHPVERQNHNNESHSLDILMSTTDSMTLLREILGILYENHHIAGGFRSSIVQSYLNLDLGLFSKSEGHSLATSFTRLITRMGGLRMNEKDDCESLLQRRLLSDLTHPHSALQVECLRCLSSTRLNPLKPYRDSLIELTEGARFRDQLGTLNDTLLPNLRFSEKGDVLNSNSDFILDVLIRICFSKMTGKANRTESRRGAALSFIMSALPDGIAMPRIINLVLTPLAGVVQETEKELCHGGTGQLIQAFPPTSVQLGLLTSVESILKYCLQTLDSASRRKVCTACVALLRKASRGSTSKGIRSRSLRVLASMLNNRANDVSFVIRPVLMAMRKCNFEVDETAHKGEPPSFLHFVAAVFVSALPKEQEQVIREEHWAVIWSMRMLRASRASSEAARLSLLVARSVSDLLVSHVNATPDSSISFSGILPHYSKVTDELVASLQQFLQRLAENMLASRNSKKTWDLLFMEALQIVERLIQTSSLHTKSLVTIFCGLAFYLESTQMFESSYVHSLKVLTAIAHQLHTQESQVDNFESSVGLAQIQNSAMSLLPLFSNIRFARQVNAHIELCKLLAALGGPDLQAVAHCMQMMNAIEKSRIDSPDVDGRLDAVNSVIAAVKRAMADSLRNDNFSGEIRLPVPESTTTQHVEAACSAEGILALVHGCVLLVRFDDVAVRGTSGYALQLLAKWSSRSNLKKAKECRHRIFRLLMDAVISATVGVVRREYVRAFAEVVRHAANMEGIDNWNGYSSFPMLKHICNQKDVDSDFFENVVHLQSHRRSRALRQIQKEMIKYEEQSNDDEERSAREAVPSFASNFALPLAMQIALELSEDFEQRNMKSRHAESRASSERDVSVWAMELVGVSARWLQWPELQSHIKNLMRKIRYCEHDRRSKTLYKLLVAMVAAVPHNIPVGEALDVSMRRFLLQDLVPALLTHVTAGGIGGNHIEINEAMPGKHGRTDRGTSSSAIFRAPVANAVAYIIICLPSSDKDIIIPQLVTPVANALRSRKTALRDSAKKALNSVIATLGTRYLPYILRQVLSALTEGFRKDACVYVIHSILMGIRDTAEKATRGGSHASTGLEGATRIIAEYLSQELKSGTSIVGSDFEDPNTTAFLKKQASARATRSCECAEILAERIDFGRSARVLLQPFKNSLSGSPSSRLVKRIETVLSRVLTGFVKNSSMELKDALKLSYEVVSHEMDSMLQNDECSLQAPKNNNALRNSHVSQSSALMISFGLQFLCTIVSKNQVLFSGISSESREYQSMLQPFLPFIVQALKTSDDTLTIVALRATQQIMKLPLSKKDVARMMANRIADVLSHSGGMVTHGDALFNSCLRAAAVLMFDIENGGFKTMSKERVEALVSVSCKSLEGGGLEARSAALALLKAAVRSKIMIPAVYDAIEKINEIAIHSQSSSLRSSCIALSVQFIISFPLGSRRVRQHLEFFLRNLNYELPTGRLASLQVIRTFILKFPSEALTDESQYLFVALAASAARDSDVDCRKCASEALQLLFEKALPGRGISDLLNMSTTLVGLRSNMTSIDDHIELIPSVEEDVVLSGAVALSKACRSRRMTLSQLNIIVRVLAVVLTGLKGEAKWETKYGLLEAIESAFDVQENVQQSESMEVQEHTRVLWESLPSLLIHAHPWIRLSSARLLGSHLSIHGDRTSASEKRPTVPCSLLWDSSILLRNILRSCSAQLEAAAISESLGHQCLKNMLCIANVLFHNPAIGNLTLEQRRTKETTDKDDEEVNASEGLKVGNPGLYWLLCRISGLAVRAGTEAHDILRRGCALRFLLVTTKWWGADLVSPNQKLFIAPAMKILEHKTTSISQHERSAPDSALGKDNTLGMDELKEIAGTLQEALVEVLGGSTYYGAYNLFRSERVEKKQARKRQAAFELAINPERAAKKRRKRAESRKRKMKRA